MYVLPSVDEPFPMSVLESLAVGTPGGVHATAAASPPDSPRREAALVTDGSPEQLADAVLRLLEDRPLRERLTRRGPCAVDAEFSLAAVTDRLAEWYSSARPARRTK